MARCFNFFRQTRARRNFNRLVSIGLFLGMVSGCDDGKSPTIGGEPVSNELTPVAEPVANPEPTVFVEEGAREELQRVVQMPDDERVAEVAGWMEDEVRVFSPGIQDRAFWDQTALNRAGIISEAESLLREPIPDLPDELYLDYGKTGRRPPFEIPYRERLDRVWTLVLAETLENEGRFLKALDDAILAILDEKTWVMPAHDGNTGYQNFHGRKVDVDLGAVMRAATLTTAINWLDEQLEADTVQRTRDEIRRRVVDPYLSRVVDQRGVCGWVNVENNWNSVCHAGVVYATLGTVADKLTRARVVASAAALSQNYLNGFTPDGYCSEGMGYWVYGFGHFVSLAERILLATGGQLNLYADPVVAEVATFPARFRLAPQTYPAFSDNSSAARPPAWIESLLARRIALPEVTAGSSLSSGKHPLGGMLYEVDLTLNPPPASDQLAKAPRSSNLRGWFPNAGVLISRPTEQVDGLAVAMKAGHNDEHHNHNDVGSYVVAAFGQVTMGDVGGEVYTKRTFGPERYKSNVLNSYGHPVPVVDGRLQKTGRQAEGVVTRADFTAEQDIFEVDLKDLYRVDGLNSLVRTFTYDRSDSTSLVIEDTFSAARPITFETALVTCGSVTQSEDGTLTLIDGNRGVSVAVETDGIPWTLEEIEIDENMVDRRKPTRVGIRLDDPTESATIRVTVKPLSKAIENEIIDLSALGAASEGDRIRVEAEELADERGGTVDRVKRPGVSGDAIRLWDNAGHELTWKLNVPSTGRYFIVLRYANGNVFPANRSVSIDGKVPAGAADGFEFPPTGGWGMSLEEWRTGVLARKGRGFAFPLEAGTHDLRIVNSRGGGLNLDWIELLPVND